MKFTHFKENTKFSLLALAWIISAYIGAEEYLSFDSMDRDCFRGCERNHFFDTIGFRADFLYWKPSTDGIPLGRENFEIVNVDLHELPTNVFIDDTESFRSKDFNFKFDPGFRIGLNYLSPCKGWDSVINWTHFHSKAKASGFSDIPESLSLINLEATLFRPLWEVVPRVFPDVATGHWKLTIDLVDLEFGYKYLFCSYLNVRPFTGIRAGRIDQSIHVFAEAHREASPFDNLHKFTSKSAAKCDYLGIGPRLGLDLGLDLGCGVSLCGQAAGSILFGQYKLHSNENFHGLDERFFPENVLDSIYHERETIDRSRVITDLQLGLKWDRDLNWCNKEYLLSLAILWEHHCFFKMTNFNFVSARDAQTGKPIENLYTQGLTVFLNIGF